MPEQQPFVLRPRKIGVRAQDRMNRYARDLRTQRRDAGECVNGCGPRTHGCRCFRCWLVHRIGVERATALLRKSIAHCAHCEQLIPEGYAVDVPELGKLHARCARFVAVETQARSA